MNRGPLIVLLLPLVFAVNFGKPKSIDIFTGSWNGIVVLLATDRCILQEKLDTYYTSYDVYNNEDNTTKLYLPEHPVFPGSLTNDQHPVFIAISRVTSLDLDQKLQDHPDSCLSASRMEVTLTIPLLAKEPSGPPLYALALAVLYERGREDFPRTNPLYPFLPVDEITMNNNSVVIRNGSEEIRANFTKYDDPCKPPPTVAKDEIKEFVEGDLQFGLPEPGVSVCDRHRPLNERFCSFVESFGGDFHLNAPNICETWKELGHEICKTSVDTMDMSRGFRDLMLLNNEPIKVIASEYSNSNFTVGLKYPCIE